MRCLQCDYDLIGLSDNRCPECGLPFSRQLSDNRFTNCPGCCYDMIRATDDRCPACGTQYEPEEVERIWNARIIESPEATARLLAPPAAVCLASLSPPLVGIGIGGVLLAISVLAVVFYGAFNCDQIARRLEYSRVLRPPCIPPINPQAFRVRLVAAGLYVTQLVFAIVSSACCASVVRLPNW